MIFRQKSKVYSKTLTSKQSKIFNPANFDNLSKFDNDKDAIFLHDEHDRSLRNTSFDDMMDDVHWEFFSKNTTTKILINFSSDYINLHDLNKIFKTIQARRLDTSRIYFLVMDQNYVDFVNNYFSQKNITDVKVGWYNVWLTKTPLYDGKTRPMTARFSIFSRNFNQWRLRLFAELKEEQLLTNFKFSFGTRNPYSGEEHPKEKLLKLLPETGFNKPISKSLEDWLAAAPYLLDEGHNKFSTVTNDTLLECGVHLLIESHFDPYATEYSLKYLNIPSEQYSPGFSTEKTWKVIMSGVPFIAFTTPHFLSDLRKLGFKTYSPFIDESYDVIEDNDNRLTAIVKEIKRLSTLDDEGFSQLIYYTKEIAAYNREHVIEMKSNIKFSDQVDFINQIKAK